MSLYGCEYYDCHIPLVIQLLVSMILYFNCAPPSLSSLLISHTFDVMFTFPTHTFSLTSFLQDLYPSVSPCNDCHVHMPTEASSLHLQPKSCLPLCFNNMRWDVTRVIQLCYLVCMKVLTQLLDYDNCRLTVLSALILTITTFPVFGDTFFVDKPSFPIFVL